MPSPRSRSPQETRGSARSITGIELAMAVEAGHFRLFYGTYCLAMRVLWH